MTSGGADMQRQKPDRAGGASGNLAQDAVVRSQTPTLAATMK